MRQPPTPLIDNLENIRNPYRYKPALLDRHQRGILVEPQQAEHELTLAVQYLYSYRGSPDTFATYRREIERLLQWAWFHTGTLLSALKREHFESYVEFCQKPPAHWIGIKNVSRFIDLPDNTGRQVNPEWRPFVAKIDKRQFKNGLRAAKKDYALSGSAVRSLFAVCSSFFNFLIQEEYTEQNPVAQIRQKSKFIRKHQSAAPIRRLSNEQWWHVIDQVRLNAESSEDTAKYERMLFIMTALYSMYLRISELVESARWQPGMADFWQDSTGHWWFTTVGKGNKQRDVSVSDAMLKALTRYRLYLGLTKKPMPGENMPLLPKTRGKGGISSTRQVRNIVQEAFDLAVAALAQNGNSDEAESLKLATVHWLRHTGISEDVKSRPREHVRDDAGHGSSAITDRYIDVERTERNESARHKPVLNTDKT